MSFPRYGAYKDSGVEWLGEVPEHWTIVSLKWLSPVLRGASPRPIDDPKYFDENGEYSWVRIADVSASDGFLVSTTQRLSSLGSSLSVKLKPESLFLSIAGTVGKPCITKIHACIHDGFVYFPQLDVDHRLLFRIFEDGLCFGGLGKMGTQLNLNTETVGGIKIALPPSDELNLVLAFLDRETTRIDALIAEQQRLIELLKEKRQAVISHAVTKGLDPTVPMKDSGVEWLGEVPAHWETGSIKYLSKLISKGTTPTTVGASFRDTGIRFLKAENINPGEVLRKPEFFISEDAHKLLSRSALKEHDVLVVIAGATTGKSAVLSKDLLPANTNQAVSFIRLRDPAYSEFVHLWLSTEKVQNSILINSVQSAQPNLSMEDLGNVPILMPPLPEMQYLIASLSIKTQRYGLLINQALEAVSLLNERRSALISAAVTGKIDLRDWQAPASA